MTMTHLFFLTEEVLMQAGVWLNLSAASLHIEPLPLSWLVLLPELHTYFEKAGEFLGRHACFDRQEHVPIVPCPLSYLVWPGRERTGSPLYHAPCWAWKVGCDSSSPSPSRTP